MVHFINVKGIFVLLTVLRSGSGGQMHLLSTKR